MGLVPIVGSDGLDWTYGTDQAGIVEHDVQPPVLWDRPFDERFDVRFIRRVSMLKHRTAARCHNFTDYSFTALRVPYCSRAG